MQPTPTYNIAVLPGDGIGPEVMDEAVRVLEAAASAHGFALAFESYPVGGIAIDLHGEPLPEKTQAACRRRAKSGRVSRSRSAPLVRCSRLGRPSS